MRLGWFVRMLKEDVEVRVWDKNENDVFRGTAGMIVDGIVAPEVAEAEVADWQFHSVFSFVLVKVKL